MTSQTSVFTDTVFIDFLLGEKILEAGIPDHFKPQRTPSVATYIEKRRRVDANDDNF